MRAIAPQKILAFLLGTLIFYPYKFSGTEPSNFCVRGVELLIRLVLSRCCQTFVFTVARQIFATLDADLLPQMQQQRVEAPNGENRILQRPFRLQPFSQKMEVVFHCLSRTRKTLSAQLDNRDSCLDLLNPENCQQKLWHDQRALFSAHIWVNGCGVVGQTVSRQFLTCRNWDQYNPCRYTHHYPVSLN